MTHILLLVLDLGGTFVFAISGGMMAVKHRLDIFGVLVLSFAAGNAGGITRDLLIGAAPPAANDSTSTPKISSRCLTAIIQIGRASCRERV